MIFIIITILLCDKYVPRPHTANDYYLIDSDWREVAWYSDIICQWPWPVMILSIISTAWRYYDCYYSMAIVTMIGQPRPADIAGNVGWLVLWRTSYLRILILTVYIIVFPVAL